MVMVFHLCLVFLDWGCLEHIYRERKGPREERQADNTGQREF